MPMGFVLVAAAMIHLPLTADAATTKDHYDTNFHIFCVLRSTGLTLESKLV